MNDHPVTVWCEWDIEQANLVFDTDTAATKWLQVNPILIEIATADEANVINDPLAYFDTGLLGFHTLTRMRDPDEPPMVEIPEDRHEDLLYAETWKTGLEAADVDQWEPFYNALAAVGIIITPPDEGDPDPGEPVEIEEGE